MRFSYFELKGK